MAVREVMVITGTRKGIGRFLAEYYVERGYQVVGCSRTPAEHQLSQYQHYCLDVADEGAVSDMFGEIRRQFGRVDVLINNAGIASMNHTVLTPLSTVKDVFSTNVFGTFLVAREAAKSMIRRKYGRIVNFSTIATPLRLEGEAIYSASKAAVVTLTEILAKELSPYNITVNAVGPTPIQTDLIRNVPQAKIDALIQTQAIKRLGEYRDIANVIDFLISPKSDFITAQTIYLGGIT